MDPTSFCTRYAHRDESCPPQSGVASRYVAGSALAAWRGYDQLTTKEAARLSPLMDTDPLSGAAMHSVSSFDAHITT